MRIIFNLNGINYKFMRILENKTDGDNSFYFHFHENKNELLKLAKIVQIDNNNFKIENKFNEFEFYRQHLSIHESGRIHSKSYNGDYLDTKLKGIPFEEIEVTKLVMLIIPKRLDELEKEHKIKNGDLIIPVAESNTFFSINIEVFRVENQNKLNWETNNFFINQFFIPNFNNKDFGLRI